MTLENIMDKQAKANVKFEISKQIREILNEARLKYGEQDWENDDMEAEIQTLVFDDNE